MNGTTTTDSPQEAYQQSLKRQGMYARLLLALSLLSVLLLAITIFFTGAYTAFNLYIVLPVSIMTVLMAIIFTVLIIMLRYNQRAQQQLFDMANKDVITGLPNRRYLFNYLSERANDEQRNNVDLQAFFIDLDNFKHVNDGAGHDIGDALLGMIASILSRTLTNFAGASERENLTVRLGGDEFVQLYSADSTLTAEQYCQTVLSAFRESAELESFIKEYQIGLSIGIAHYPSDTRDYNELIKFADIAMYYSKHHGKNTYSTYRREMGDQVDGFTLSVRSQAPRK